MIKYVTEEPKFYKYKSALVTIEDKYHPIDQILPLFAARIYKKSKIIYNEKIAKALQKIQKLSIDPVFPPDEEDTFVYDKIENLGYEIGYMDHDLNKAVYPVSLEEHHNILQNLVENLKQTNFVTIENGIVSTPLSEDEFIMFETKVRETRNTFDQFKNACFWVTIMDNNLMQLAPKDDDNDFLA